MPSKVISSAYNCRIAYNWLRNFWFYGQLRADGASDQTRVFLMPEYVSLTAIISFLFKGRPLMQIHNLMSGRLLSCSWSRITVDRDYCVMTSLGKLDTKQLFFYDSRSNWSLTSSLRFDAGTSCGGKSTHFNVHDNWEKILPYRAAIQARDVLRSKHYVSMDWQSGAHDSNVNACGWWVNVSWK